MSNSRIYIIPNLVTSANLFCGFYAIALCAQDKPVRAAWVILLGAVFDMLDGRIARMAKATSNFGVQYDSLSDLTTFGIAPAFLAFSQSLEPFGRLGIIVCFLYVVSVAFRLARFNVSTHLVSKGFFQGLASPVAAGSLVTFALLYFSTSLHEKTSPSFSALYFGGLSLVLSFLMVSRIPFLSFKEVNWRARSSFKFLLGAVIGLALILYNPEVNLFLINTTYIGGSVVWWSYRKLFKKRHASPRMPA